MDMKIEPNSKHPRTRVSGIDRALQVIDHLLESGEPAGPYAIAKAIGAPLSTAYAIIGDLADKGLLSRRGNGTVWLGPRLHYYGLAYARSLDVLNEAAHEMHALCREVNETVQVCGRDGDHMVVLGMAEADRHLRVTARVGTRVPLNWTASGRLLVGHLPEAERLEVFRRCAVASPTGKAETDAVTLAAEARRTFAERLSVQLGASDFWIACMASPIRDPSGACLATISIVLPEQKVASDGERLGAAVRAAAERIERAMGGR